MWRFNVRFVQQNPKKSKCKERCEQIGLRSMYFALRTLGVVLLPLAIVVVVRYRPSVLYSERSHALFPNLAWLRRPDYLPAGRPSPAAIHPADGKSRRTTRRAEISASF